MEKALKSEINLDNAFLGEAVYTETYLLKGVHQMLLKCGMEGNLTNLHIFGRKAYAKTLEPTKKLAYRCDEYSLGSFCLWDMKI